MLLLLFCLVCAINADNFPSLLTTNATLAIIIDREYMADKHDEIKAVIENYIVYAKRELLKHGGVNVQYYSWITTKVKRDTTAVLSMASCRDTWKLFNAAEDENLLLMAISESDCPRLPPDEAVTVPMIQPGQEMPQLVLDLRIISAYKWSSVIILYDDTLERDMVTRVISGFTAESSDLKINGAAVSLMFLDTNARAHNRRQIVRGKLATINTDLMGTNFLAVVALDMVEILMEEAKQLGLVSTRNQWAYVVCDTNWKRNNISYLRELLKEGDNVAFLYNTTTGHHTCTGGLKCHAEEMLESFVKGLDAAILYEHELASQVSDEEWEAIRPTKLERRNFLLGKVKNYLLQRGTCDNCTSWRLQTGETWGKEYQTSGEETVGDLLQVGYWRPSDGPALTDALFPHIAHGFRGRNLPLVSFNNPPWQILKINSSGSVIEYSGLVFDIINELSRNLNFTFTIQVVNEGIVNNMAKWNRTASMFMSTDITTLQIPLEIVNMIRKKEAAIAACGFTVSEDAKAVINFTSEISIQTYSFLVARPRELSRALLFMSPFTYGTWFCLAICVLVMGPILFLIHRFSPVYEYEGISNRTGGLSSVENCMWFMYGALLQQGGMHLPFADSARLIVGTWWLVVLVIATTYCGNLVAFLTFPKIEIPITTVRELLARTDAVTWSLPTDSYFEKQLRESTNPSHIALYRGRSKRELNLDYMIYQVEQGKHVYFDWKMKLYYYMKKQFLEKDRCDLALGSEEFFIEKIAMIVAQDTPYLGIINAEIKRLHQTGLIEKWFKNYLPRRDRCFKVSRITEVNNHTVNMDDMQGSFFVLFLGFLVAMLWLIAEKLCRRHHVRKQERVQPFTT